MATEQEELENLKKNSPYALPDDPASSGWTTAQIKEKFYAGLLVLYGYLKVERGRLDSLEESGLPNVIADLAKISTGQTVVGKALGDKNGDDIATTYVKLSALASGLVTCLKYLKEDGTTTENIWQIEKNLNNFISSYNTFIATYFVNGKAKNAINAENVEKAMKDDLGNIIKNTYATIANLAVTNAEITKIKNGGTIANKAYNDQDGNLIPNTYIKIANIINNLTSTDTDKPLSAYQGKQLKAMIDNINTILGSNDTDLDTLQELVNWIHDHEDDYTALTTGKINYTDIITNYTSNVNNKPVSASVAYALKGLIDNLVNGTTKAKKAENADYATSAGSAVTATKASQDSTGTPFEDKYAQLGDIVGGLFAIREYDQTTGELEIVKIDGSLDFTYDQNSAELIITEDN